MGFNPEADNHECAYCQYGGYYTEQGKPAGNVCRHPDVIEMGGLRYGRYFANKTVPEWCPDKEYN